MIPVGCAHAQCPPVTMHVVQFLTDLHSFLPEIGYVMARHKILSCCRYYRECHNDKLAISRAENSGGVQPFPENANFLIFRTSI